MDIERLTTCRAEDFQARREGPMELSLTSNPKRVAANALYRSLGFERKETNFYKIEL